MKRYIFILFTFCFSATSMLAQLDSIQNLDEVVVVDTKLTKYSEGFKVKSISDSLTSRNNTSLTDVLRFNSSIYFKENGYGMVSSPSFRGTNASQTAVIWNGISINSSLNGQTDFNIIVPNAADQITIRSGGGSVQYGSGAIGGSVHLNNTISFRKAQRNELELSYGSYEASKFNFKSITSNKHLYSSVNVNYINSINDYKYINKELKNENGAFQKLNVGYNFGARFSNHILTWNSNYFYGDRDFSSTITAPSNNNYKDVTTRNLLTWTMNSNQFISKVKGAHLFERYRYFPDKDNLQFSEGKTNTYIADYSLDYFASEKLKFNATLNYTFIEGKGSNIGSNQRNTLSAIILMKHKVSSKLSYGVNVRQEFLNEFENPLLVSLDGKYQLQPWYAIKTNASRNYRVPTFNDLYWDAGGNIDLKPETSIQAEIGNVFNFSDWELSLNGFYIDSKDLISWRPNETGLWQPINIAETENYGLEFSSEFSKRINQHALSLLMSYSYTKAINKEKNKQLLYVPFHKATGLLQYQYKNISFNYQLLYNGEVFTTTDNIGIVEDYLVSNLGLEYQLNTNKTPITLGGNINNLFNIYYENVAYRPMPDRNIQIFINFKF
ncbi:MAG: TonB-dependent receptor [Flavobacteriaceae bacterium]|nr:TonB-dependent receptor [Flavobacteriaceae bacterium]